MCSVCQKEACVCPDEIVSEDDATELDELAEELVKKLEQAFEDIFWEDVAPRLKDLEAELLSSSEDEKDEAFSVPDTVAELTANSETMDIGSFGPDEALDLPDDVIQVRASMLSRHLKQDSDLGGRIIALLAELAECLNEHDRKALPIDELLVEAFHISKGAAQLVDIIVKQTPLWFALGIVARLERQNGVEPAVRLLKTLRLSHPTSFVKLSVAYSRRIRTFKVRENVTTWNYHQLRMKIETWDGEEREVRCEFPHAAKMIALLAKSLAQSKDTKSLIPTQSNVREAVVSLTQLLAAIESTPDEDV